MSDAEQDDAESELPYVPAPCIDYNKPHIAEQEAAHVVRKIIHESSQLLYLRYLERKAYPFAVDAAVQAAIAGTQMCFVPCETGAEDLSEWTLEEEPQPAIRDSWVRLSLPNKNEAKMRGTFASSKDSGFGGRKATRKATLGPPGSAQKAVPEEGRKKKEGKEEGPRMWSVEEKTRIDRDEEKARESKIQTDAKNREAEKKRREKARAAERERIRLEALHKEMDEKPHTFDMDGNVMWVEQVNLAKLPKVSELVNINIKRDKRYTDKDSTLSNSTTNLATTVPKAKPRPKRLNRKKEKDSEFPDGYIPLQHQQPPILETMEPKTGVSLEYKGKRKEGPRKEYAEGKMSRAEYNALAVREISGNTMLQFTQSGGVRAVGGNSGNSPTDANRKSQPNEGQFSDGGSPGNLAKSDSLPAIDKGRPPPQEGGRSPSKGNTGMVLAGSGAGVSPKDASALAGSKEESKTDTLPIAPPVQLRRRYQFDTIGNLGRHPRSKPPLLGTLDVFSHKPRHPPLGATMGHGLLRSETSVEEFFFPAPFAPDAINPAELGMPRSKSDSYLPHKAEADMTRLPVGAIQSPKNTQSWDDPPSQRSPKHGSIIPDSFSPAYRNVRAQLFESDQRPQGVR